MTHFVNVPLPLRQKGAVEVVEGVDMYPSLKTHSIVENHSLFLPVPF
jgi:hypothetical protein